ncbi:hypothetical protein B0H13DRAFT_1650432, partial [Mycena leptocephala]
IFRPLWALGEPLLVTNVRHNVKVNWSPDYFIQKYGNRICKIMDWQTDATQKVSVTEFFATFGQYKGWKKCWKLKVSSPPSGNAAAFPELYEDFSQAVPILTHVRQDGALNIASHFPSSSIGPDLGT